jgi:hypothetical protein
MRAKLRIALWISVKCHSRLNRIGIIVKPPVTKFRDNTFSCLELLQADRRIDKGTDSHDEADSVVFNISLKKLKKLVGLFECNV